MKERPKIRKDDPAFVALNKVVEALDGFSRKEQLRIMTNVCTNLGETAFARHFLKLLEDEIANEESEEFEQEFLEPLRGPR